MNIVFFTVLLFSVAATGAYSQACHMREVELCLAIGIFQYKTNGIPVDDEKIAEWCETMEEIEKCMGNFSSKCLSPLQIEVMGLMSGADDDARQMCVEGSEVRAHYLPYSECLAEGSETDEFKGHMRDIQVVIEKLFEVPFKQRLSLGCCGFRRFQRNTDQMTRKRCGDGAVEMIDTIIEMVTTDLPGTICKQFDPLSDECLKILPPSGTKSKGVENSQISKIFATAVGEN